MNNDNIYEIDFQKRKYSFFSRIIRSLLFSGILILVAFSNNLFSNPTTKLTTWILLFLNFTYYMLIISKEYRIIFLSILFENEEFKIAFLKNGKKECISLFPISVEVRKISVNNYSTKTNFSVSVKLKSNDNEIKFRILLKEMILLFNFIEKNGGIVKKDFDFKCSLKELLSNEEYEDVRNEITELLH